MVPGIEQGAKTARPEVRGCPARSVTQIRERKYRRPTCSAGVPTTLTHRSSDLADDLGESQFGAVGAGGMQFGVSQHQTSLPPCHRSGSHHVIMRWHPQPHHTSVASMAVLCPASHCYHPTPTASRCYHITASPSHTVPASQSPHHTVTMSRVTIASHGFYRSS